jgi:aspartate racemase
MLCCAGIEWAPMSAPNCRCWRPIWGTAAGPGGSVGILASPAVRTIGIFDRALAAKGLVAAYADDQDALLATIRSIKQHGDTPSARAALNAASVDLLGKGAAVQLVACTEFSIIADAVADGAIAIDTLDVLVADIVRFATGAALEVTRLRQTM